MAQCTMDAGPSNPAAPPVSNGSAQPFGDDVFGDMQYARAGVNKDHFFSEPWKHSKDTTNTFLSLRFDRRDDFEARLSKETGGKKKVGRIHHEISRIRKTRNNFVSYSTRNRELVSGLKIAYYQWKTEAKERAEEQILALKNGAFDDDQKTRRSSARYIRSDDDDVVLLQRVRGWSVTPPEPEKLVDFEAEPQYGFKACAMHFKQHPDRDGSVTSGYYGYDEGHAGYKGGFPNQKIAVHDLLYRDDRPSALLRDDPQKTLRYFHFPANNMEWIEVWHRRHSFREVTQPDFGASAQWLDTTEKSRATTTTTNRTRKCRKLKGSFAASTGVVSYTGAGLESTKREALGRVPSMPDT